MPSTTPKAANATSPFQEARHRAAAARDAALAWEAVSVGMVRCVDSDHGRAHCCERESLRIELACDASLAQHDEPVAEFEQFFELLGHQQHRGAFRSASR